MLLKSWKFSSQNHIFFKKPIPKRFPLSYQIMAIVYDDSSRRQISKALHNVCLKYSRHNKGERENKFFSQYKYLIKLK